MSPEKEERTRLRAHEIWEREGRPEGKEAEHWERASREIESEEAGGNQHEGGRSGADQGDVSSHSQPGGTVPGDAAGASPGSVGTSGGNTVGSGSGRAKRPPR
jgi:hypothetical protein